MTNPGHYQTDTSDMFAVHRAITGALDLAGPYVGGATDPERVEVIGSFYENVLEFLHVHHGGEDELVYPILEQRCADNRALLERIDDQHKLLYSPMDAARAAIASWRATPSPENAQAVVDALSDIDETLRPHLAEEETSILPIAGAWLSPDEWAALPGHAMANFSADKPWLALGLVRENLTDEQRAGMLAGMPEPLQQLWTNEWEPAFIAFMADVRQ